MATYKPIPEFTSEQRKRFWAKVARKKNGTGCWLWRGYKDEAGYGKYREYRAHRIAFTLSGQTIPEGLTLDHLCRNRGCVNPDHLEAVTHIENTMRGESLPARHARKTHCESGHEFTPENTIARRGHKRECRACKNRLARELRFRRKACQIALTWQGIETAPKDGSEILGLFHGYIRRVIWWSPVEGWMQPSGAVSQIALTHWLPLPPAP